MTADRLPGIIDPLHVALVEPVVGDRIVKPYTVLVITRSQPLALELRRSLDAERFVLRRTPSTKQALAMLLSPSLLLLDAPPSGGARCIAQLKGRFSAPVVALLPEGQPTPPTADAVLRRPFPMRRLADRIQSVLLPLMSHVIRAPHMSLDTGTRHLQIRGSLYRLRPIGCRIMALLMERAGQTVHRQELFQQAWQIDDTDTTRALDVQIAHLRRQLENDPGHPLLIVTDWGLGYRLEPPCE